MNYNMNESLIKALDMCRVYIGAKRNVTDEDIESAISKILLFTGHRTKRIKRYIE